MTKDSTENSLNKKSLQNLQNEARAVIDENLKSSKIQAIDQMGIAQNFAIKDGEPRPSNIIGFAGDAADVVAKKLGDLYQHFREKEFETLIEEGRDEDANKYFFGVIFPRQYQGNNDPLTMTEGQVFEAEKFLGKDDGRESKGSWAKNVRSESLGEKAKELPAFHSKENKDWLQKILSGNKPDASKNFADRFSKESWATRGGRD